ncbi:MAG: AsmA family protein, partial [Desulfobacterales bacterium]
MRWKRIIGMSVFLIVAVVAAVYVVLATYDYNKLKPRLARMVKEATGRELQLGGEIDFAMGLSPTLVVTDANLANASWGSQPQMIKIDKLELQFRLLPLLFKDLNVNRLGLSGARVLLETGPEAQPNW